MVEFFHWDDINKKAVTLWVKQEFLICCIFEVCWLNILIEIHRLFMGSFGFVSIKNSRDYSGDRGYLFLCSLCMFYVVPTWHSTGRLNRQRCSCSQAVLSSTAGWLYDFTLLLVFLLVIINEVVLETPNWKAAEQDAINASAVAGWRVEKRDKWVEREWGKNLRKLGWMAVWKSNACGCWRNRLTVA